MNTDGRGRVFDNIFIERLWRTVKYEDIYIKGYTSVPALVAGLEDYFYLLTTSDRTRALATGYPLTIILLLARFLEV